jgi:uncharacterized membrane protein
MTLERRVRRRAVIWVAVLTVFVLLLLLANRFTEGERFYDIASFAVLAIALVALLGLYRATAGEGIWRIRTRHIAVMAGGATAYAVVAYAFNELIPVSIGPISVQPQVCIPVLFGYAFTPIVGFFTGAVGSLMGDFLSGWGVFPAWHVGSGLIGLVPGLVALVSYERQNLRYLSALVIALMGVTAAIIFVHPRAPEPWTGQVQSFLFWGWILMVGSLIMVANSFLLERLSLALAGLNLWGALGIIVGNGFTSLAHIWINEYGLATAVIGEFAPAVGEDVLNLVIFTPLLLAGYSAVRSRGR